MRPQISLTTSICRSSVVRMKSVFEMPRRLYITTDIVITRGEQSTVVSRKTKLKLVNTKKGEKKKQIQMKLYSLKLRQML